MGVVVTVVGSVAVDVVVPPKMHGKVSDLLISEPKVPHSQAKEAKQIGGIANRVN